MLSEQKMKNKIREVSQETGLAPQQLYGLFGMEQLVKRLSETKYRDHFILKGGYLLASKYGLSQRATQDLDATIQNMALTREKVEEIVHELTMPDTSNQKYFSLLSIRETREDFQYNGYNIKLLFQNGQAKFPIDIDMTTGEELLAISEDETIPLMFEEGVIHFPAYPVEQILADKFYTMLAYGTDGTRMKDYYDLYILPKFNESIDYEKVHEAVDRTLEQRNITVSVERYFGVAEEIEQSPFQQKLWNNWQKQLPYASNLSFQEMIVGLKQVTESITQYEAREMNQSKERNRKR